MVCLDLVHHLARPRDFFAEAARVLRPGGRLAAIEPWVSPMSYPIYRWLHEEGCDLGIDPWDPFAARAGAKEAFEGNGALTWRVVRSGDARQWAGMGLGPPRVRALNAFGYLLTLGFRKGSLLPTGAGAARAPRRRPDASARPAHRDARDGGLGPAVVEARASLVVRAAHVSFGVPPFRNGANSRETA